MSLGQADLPLEVCAGQGWGCPAAHQSPPQQLLTGPGSTHGAEEAGLGESSTPRGGSLWKNTALCIHGTWCGLCYHSGSVLGQVPRPSNVQGRVSAVLVHSISCSGCGVTWSCAHTTLLTFLCAYHATDIAVMLLKLFKQSIVLNLPLCLLFLLLKEKNIIGVLRCTILPTPR